MSTKHDKTTRRIREIKKLIQKIGPMMPGSLSQQQRRDANDKTYGSYWKLGYTHKMKSRSHYIPDELVKAVQAQNAEFKRFKKLTEEWINLALTAAKKELEEAKKQLKN
jgi:hypothetical protein